MSNLQFNNYQELKVFNREEVAAFPKFYAFTDEQYYEGMKKLGVQDEKDGVLVDCGCFIRLSDVDAWGEMWDRIKARKVEALKDEKFLKQALIDELFNYEYGYALEDETVEQVLRVLGFSWEDVDSSKKLFKALESAKKYVEKHSCY